jgi:dimethylamine/trimethylamine dehydrogenase
VLEDTREAVGDRCAVALRFAVDEMIGADGITSDGEGRDVVERLAELPDLWDVNVSTWSNDSATSRFQKEGYQEDFTRWVKSVTTKPVVGVGRYTSPDRMVSLVKSGVLDFIGAARPSIADPFLPKKIEEGRFDEIRECIGCNMCVSSDYTNTNLRCTQNPTMGEEWRRGWHPERIAPKGSDHTVLVVGAGPAGLEAALAAGRRGYEVHLAEAGTELGGRVSREARLPGLSEWGRVRDWRVTQLSVMPNVHIYRDSPLTAEDVLAFGAGHVAIATGAEWRRDGVGRDHGAPVPGFDDPRVFTPDDLMNGKRPDGPVVVFDDDHYYMGGVLAELCRSWGLEVTLVTPANIPSAWTVNTLEQGHIAKRLARQGIAVVTSATVTSFGTDSVEILDYLPGTTRRLKAGGIVTVTARLPREGLYEELAAAPEKLEEAGISTLRRIGDVYAPSTIQAATYWGHRFARELDAEVVAAEDLPRELPQAAPLRRHWA